MLHATGIGQVGEVGACIHGISTSASYDTSVSAPSTVSAVLIDTELYADWRVIRVALQVHDSAFNTRTNRDRVHITAVGSEGTRAANCRPSRTNGSCVATITVPPRWVDGSVVTVSYGLGGTLESQVVAGQVTPVPSQAATYTDNLAMMVPSRPLLGGEQFDVMVEAQVAQDVESAKFTVAFAGVELEIVGTPTGIHEQVWSYQFVVRSDGITAVLNRKPDAVPLTSQPQQSQQLVQVRMRVKDGITTRQSSLELRVLELNAPVPIDPGGQPIPQDGHVLGNVAGRLYSQHAAGQIYIVEDVVLALFAYTDTGDSTIVNTARLTATDVGVDVIAEEVHRYGVPLRMSPIVTCSLGIAHTDPAITTSASAGGQCAVTFGTASTSGYSALSIDVHTDAASTSATLRVWAPEIPLTITADATVLRPIALSVNGERLQTTTDGGCTDHFMRSHVKAHTRFLLDPQTTSVLVDVTHLVASRMSVNASGVVDLTTTMPPSIMGVADGSVEVTFGDLALGSITVVVDSTVAVHVDSFDVASFSAIDMSVVPAVADVDGTVSASVVFHQDNLTREGPEGRQHLAASITLVDPSDGSQYSFDALAEDFNVSFASAAPAVANVVQGSQLEALGSGEAQLNGILSHQGGCGGSITLQSRPTFVTVVLPPAVSAHIANDAGQILHAVKLAHHEDAAYMAAAAPREQRIRVIVVYDEYTRDLTDDPRTTLVYSDDGPFTVDVCSETDGVCLIPKASISGTGELQVVFSHEEVVGSTTVNVVRGTSIDLQPRPYPSWSGSDSVVADELSLIGSTGVYQRAALSASLGLSDGTHTAVYRGHGLVHEVVLDSALAQLVHRSAFLPSVVWPSTSGVVSVRVRLAGSLSSTVNITALATAVTVSDFDELQVPGIVDGTVYGVRGAPSTNHLEYGALLSDGSYISAAAMFNDFDGTFRTALVTFSSLAPDVLPIDATSGAIRTLANHPSTITLRVEAVGAPVVSRGIALYSNLATAGIDADFATDQSRVSRLNPLEAIAVGDMVHIKVYVSTGADEVGSLTMEMDFDPTELAFRSVAKGTDDGVWDDTVTGEVRSDDPSVVRFGGITTNYASGDNWHFATVSFESIGVAGATVFFGGRIVEVADSAADLLQPTDAPIDAGQDSALVIGNGGSERRRRRRSLDARQSQSILARARRQVSGCIVESGPYPLGDVNSDCQFSGIDALLTAQYTLVNDDPVASAAFVASSGLSVTAMDADNNGHVNTRDTTTMLYILFGGMRFVMQPQLELQSGGAVDGCHMSVSVAVEQGSSDGTYSTDPARAARTEIVMLFTGTSGVAASLTALDWDFVSLDHVASTGRSAGYVHATANVSTGVYSVQTSFTADVSFGVSVIQIVETADGWSVPLNGQYINVGSPFPLSAQTENQQRNLATSLTVNGDNVDFSYAATFAPMRLVDVDETDPLCASSTSMTSITSTSTTFIPTARPSDAPTHSPSVTPSAEPTLFPSELPSTDETPQLSISPTLSPSVTPSAEPTLFPSELPSTDEAPQPSIAPTLSASPTSPLSTTRSPTGMPLTTPTSRPSNAPTDEPTSPPFMPSLHPSIPPSMIPTESPTSHPTSEATVRQTRNPSTSPTVRPSEVPSSGPTFSPFPGPTAAPFDAPSAVVPVPTASPSMKPVQNAPTSAHVTSPPTSLFGVNEEDATSSDEDGKALRAPLNAREAGLLFLMILLVCSACCIWWFMLVLLVRRRRRKPPLYFQAVMNDIEKTDDVEEGSLQDESDDEVIENVFRLASDDVDVSLLESHYSADYSQIIGMSPADSAPITPIDDDGDKYTASHFLRDSSTSSSQRSARIFRKKSTTSSQRSARLFKPRPSSLRSSVRSTSSSQRSAFHENPASRAPSLRAHEYAVLDPYAYDSMETSEDRSLTTPEPHLRGRMDPADYDTPRWLNTSNVIGRPVLDDDDDDKRAPVVYDMPRWLGSSSPEYATAEQQDKNWVEIDAAGYDAEGWLTNFKRSSSYHQHGEMRASMDASAGFGAPWLVAAESPTQDLERVNSTDYTFPQWLGDSPEQDPPVTGRIDPADYDAPRWLDDPEPPVVHPTLRKPTDKPAFGAPEGHRMDPADYDVPRWLDERAKRTLRRGNHHGPSRPSRVTFAESPELQTDSQFLELDRLIADHHRAVYAEDAQPPRVRPPARHQKPLEDDLEWDTFGLARSAPQSAAPSIPILNNLRENPVHSSSVGHFSLTTAQPRLVPRRRGGRSMAYVTNFAKDSSDV